MRNLRQALLLAAASIVVCAASARTVPIATIVALQPSSSLLPACEDDLPSSEAESDSALEALAVFVGKKKISTKGSDWKTRVPQAPKLPFDPWSQYLWHVRTNVGDMTFALMPEVAPRHTESVIHLARLGFFDDTGFHRVINGFMAQGGCPLGNGTGYPGYRMDCEFSDDVRHDVAGRLSAANSGPGTESSQFFVTFGEMPHLDDVHTIMGQMIEGQDTVDKLNAAGSAAGKPKRELTITKTTISVRAKSLPSTAEGANPVLDQFREAATTANLKRDKRWQLAVPDPPAVEFDDSEWVWHMMTDAGPLAVTLSTETAPMQARSVVWLSTLGFYDGLDFFKVTKGQGLHAACPRGNGRSFAGYKLEQQIAEGVLHERGSVSAPQVSKGKEGSQFFIALGEAGKLDGRATIFGQLTGSDETLARIEALVKGSKLSKTIRIRSSSIEVR